MDGSMDVIVQRYRAVRDAVGRQKFDGASITFDDSLEAKGRAAFLDFIQNAPDDIRFLMSRIRELEREAQRGT